MSSDNTPDRDSLPVPGYDQLPLGDLSAAISGLDEGALQQLLEFETTHGNRLPVVQLLEQRREAVASGAELSGQTGADRPDETAPGATGKVSPETSGPPVNPPSQGVPMNPAQPRT